MSFARLRDTLIELVRLPSTSGHEEQVRAYLEQGLTALGLTVQVDTMGNLIAMLPGSGPALLLNAHMDRVPPGLGHEPILRDGVLYSDGTTNLGADDAAGLAIVLETLRRVSECHLSHPPLVIVFTVQEETGLCGAHTFDSAVWNAHDGIVFDNAFAAGVVVAAGAAYEAFDIQISGRTGHPGKDLAQTVDVIEIFHAAHYPHGSLNNDQTRVHIGRITGGNARNAIPDSMLIEGELRSFEPPEARQRYLDQVRNAFAESAQRLGGQIKMTSATHSSGYTVDPQEPLLRIYGQVLEQRATPLQMRPSFIGSDVSGFRPAIRAFTISTGVLDEHSSTEHVPLAPLEQLVLDIIQVLDLWSRCR